MSHHRVSAGSRRQPNPRSLVARRAPVALGLLIVALALCATGSIAAGPGGWDHLGEGAAGSNSLNGHAYALNADVAGVLYVGGAFTDAGGVADADRIATWNGTSWAALGSSQIDNGAVHAIETANGKVYAGGTFQNAGGSADADFLAVWDGASWKPFCNASGPAFAGNVDALQIIGSTLYVGGSFQNAVKNSAADYLVACDINTGEASATTIDPAHPFSGPVYALAADPNGVLYAGGRWNNLENNPAADNIAYRDAGGWHALGSGSGPCGCVIDGFVRSLAADATGVYVGTDVKDVAAIAQADSVVKWDGQAWSALGANTAGDDGWFPATAYIYGLTVAGTKVYATGSFQDANGDPLADQVASFEGGAWRSIGSDGAGNGPWVGDGIALAVFGQRLYAAGKFTNAGGDAQAQSVASHALPAPLSVTITSGPADGSTTSNRTVRFEFSSNDPAATLRCVVTVPGGAQQDFGNCSSGFEGGVRDGTWTFSVTAHRGQVSSPPATRTWTVDTVLPPSKLSGSTTQRAGSTVGVIASCGAEACTAVASGNVSVPGASRVYRLRPVERSVAAGRKAKLKVGVPKKALRAIRAALRHNRKITAKLTVRAADKAGNVRTKRRSVTLKL
jgi:hypothetical protein